jgi:hypothetical protein
LGKTCHRNAVSGFLDNKFGRSQFVGGALERVPHIRRQRAGRSATGARNCEHLPGRKQGARKRTGADCDELVVPPGAELLGQGCAKAVDRFAVRLLLRGLLRLGKWQIVPKRILDCLEVARR